MAPSGAVARKQPGTLTARRIFMDKIRGTSAWLEKIAGNYPKDSGEYKALKLSAFAYGFAIHMHEHEFATYLESVTTPLTQSEEENLKKSSRKPA